MHGATIPSQAASGRQALGDGWGGSRGRQSPDSKPTNHRPSFGSIIDVVPQPGMGPGSATIPRRQRIPRTGLHRTERVVHAPPRDRSPVCPRNTRLPRRTTAVCAIENLTALNSRPATACTLASRSNTTATRLSPGPEGRTTHRERHQRAQRLPDKLRDSRTQRGVCDDRLLSRTAGRLCRGIHKRAAALGDLKRVALSSIMLAGMRISLLRMDPHIASN